MSFSARLHANAIGWVLPVLVIAGWEIASRAGVMPANVLPAPSAVAEAFWRLTLSGELIRNIGVSTARALAGFADAFDAVTYDDDTAIRHELSRLDVDHGHPVE